MSLNGEPITIPAAKVVKFHPSKKFKEAVNK
ncbi:HU family DNA-binding protein [uncultured Turicimonas sp.]